MLFKFKIFEATLKSLSLTSERLIGSDRQNFHPQRIDHTTFVGFNPGSKQVFGVGYQGSICHANPKWVILIWIWDIYSGMRWLHSFFNILPFTLMNLPPRGLPPCQISSGSTDFYRKQTHTFPLCKRFIKAFEKNVYLGQVEWQIYSFDCKSAPRAQEQVVNLSGTTITTGYSRYILSLWRSFHSWSPGANR